MKRLAELAYTGFGIGRLPLLLLILKSTLKSIAILQSALLFRLEHLTTVSHLN